MPSSERPHGPAPLVALQEQDGKRTSQLLGPLSQSWRWRVDLHMIPPHIRPVCPSRSGPPWVGPHTRLSARPNPACRRRRPGGPTPCSAKPLCFPVAVGHGAKQAGARFAGQLVGGMETHHRTGSPPRTAGPVLLQHLRPAVVGPVAPSATGKPRSTKFSVSGISLSRPSSSRGSRGKRSMVKGPAGLLLGRSRKAASARPRGGTWREM